MLYAIAFFCKPWNTQQLPNNSTAAPTWRYGLLWP
jgi:hypothetical protein